MASPQREKRSMKADDDVLFESVLCTGEEMDSLICVAC